jgi:translation elongation factor P/translation initiation factor 5A
MDFASLKIGCFVVINDRVCKVIKCDFSKPGKHGSGKKVVTGVDVITDKKYIHTFKDNSIFTHFTMDTHNYDVSYLEDDCMVLLTENMTELRDYDIPQNEIGEKIRKLLEEDKIPTVTILTTKVKDNSEYRVMSVSE